MARPKHVKAKPSEPLAYQPRLSAHPKARRQIDAVKAWSGLVAFGLVLYLSLDAGLPMFEAGMRAIAVGVGAYVVGWVAAVVVWRQVAVAEVEDLHRRMLAAQRDDEGAAAA